MGIAHVYRVAVLIVHASHNGHHGIAYAVARADVDARVQVAQKQLAAHAEVVDNLVIFLVSELVNVYSCQLGYEAVGVALAFAPEAIMKCIFYLFEEVSVSGSTVGVQGFGAPCIQVEVVFGCGAVGQQQPVVHRLAGVGNGIAGGGVDRHHVHIERKVELFVSAGGRLEVGLRLAVNRQLEGIADKKR